MSDAQRLSTGAVGLDTGITTVPLRVKPLFRGIPDVVATIALLPLCAALVGSARPGSATVAATVFGVSLILLLAVSATYHTPWWPLHIRRLWRRVDHSMIYVFIAGGYTPLCLEVLAPGPGQVILWLVWSVATLGCLKSFLWPNAPRALSTLIYVGMGWVAVPYVPELYANLDAATFWLFMSGGALYMAGSVVYVRRYPNPWPRTFGYHEVFHLFVIAASFCELAAVWRILV